MISSLLGLFVLLRIRRLELQGRLDDAISRSQKFRTSDVYYGSFAEVYHAKLLMRRYDEAATDAIRALISKKEGYSRLRNGDYLSEYVDYLVAVRDNNNKMIESLSKSLKKKDVPRYVSGFLPAFEIHELECDYGDSL